MLGTVRVIKTSLTTHNYIIVHGYYDLYMCSSHQKLHGSLLLTEIN